MRIVRYHPRAVLGDGGLSYAVRRWSAALGQLELETTVVHAGGPVPADTRYVHWQQVPHTATPFGLVPRGLRAAFAGADLVVLHSGWTVANLLAARAAREARVPYLLEPRGAYDPHIVARHGRRKAAWWRLAEREVVMQARGIHLFFDEERPHLAALGYGGPVVVAPNGIDVPAEATWAGGAGPILWFGRLDLEHKGLDLLIGATALLAEGERPTVRLHGAGSPRRRAALEALVRRAGVAGAVSLGGPVYGDAKEHALATAAAFVYPSRWEGFGFAPAEAVARGIPLLATPYPLASYLGTRGGAIVVESTAGGLAAGLRRARTEEARRIAGAGRRIVAADFRWPRSAASWWEQVEAIL
jgi:glycosyltransferase involved in cell wall biosynthesis